MTERDSSKGVTLQPYSEVLVSGPNEKRLHESPIAIIQALIFVFFFVTMIISLIEAQGVHFINTYIYMIVYATVGGALIIIVGTISWTLYMRGNRIAVRSAGPSAEGQNYMGWPHLMSVTLGWLLSSGAFLLITWFLSEWVTRFGKTSTDSAPDTTAEPEYTLFIGTMTISFLLSFMANAFLLHTLFAHMRPLRTLTRLYINVSQKKI